MRIISLIASSTETLCALGLEDQIVGRSHECDFPASVESIPVCSEIKLQKDLSSLEIDRGIKNLLALGLSVYKVFPDKIKDLRPDVIVTQDHCKVCAVSSNDVNEALAEYNQHDCKIISLHPNSLEDIWKDIERLGVELAVKEQAQELIQSLQKQIESISQQAQALNKNLTIACIEWIEPLMACGNWIPELVALLGGKTLIGKAAKHSGTFEWKQLLNGNPDLIFVCPCGYTIEQTRKEMHLLEQQEGWNSLHAVQNGQVYIADGNQFFNRPGPRILESLQILAEILYPDTFDFERSDQAWCRYK